MIPADLLTLLQAEWARVFGRSPAVRLESGIAVVEETAFRPLFLLTILRSRPRAGSLPELRSAWRAILEGNAVL